MLKLYKIKKSLPAVMFGVVMAMVKKSEAQEAPFGLITDKSDSLIEVLTGPLAVSLLTVTIIIVAAMWQIGKLSPSVAIKIGFGAVVISSAPKIAQWLFF